METLIYFADFFRDVGLANAFSFVFVVLIACLVVYYFPIKVRMERQRMDQEQKNIEFLHKQNVLLANSAGTVETLKDQFDSMSKTFEKIMTKLSVNEAVNDSNNEKVVSLLKTHSDLGNKILEKDMQAFHDLEQVSEEIKTIKIDLGEIHDFLIEIRAQIRRK